MKLQSNSEKLDEQKRQKVTIIATGSIFNGIRKGRGGERSRGIKENFFHWTVSATLGRVFRITFQFSDSRLQRLMTNQARKFFFFFLEDTFTKSPKAERKFVGVKVG